MKLWRAALAAAGAGLCLAAIVPASPAAAVGVQTIYMSATGSDSLSGTTPGTAVKTLGRVQEIVAAGPIDQDVEVRIHIGTYVAAQTIWQTYRPGHTRDSRR